MDIAELSIFLVNAKSASYASEKTDERATPALDGSKQLEYSDGPYRYVDVYFGGIRFSGLETVYCKSVPVWPMAYSGGITEEKYYEKSREIYEFLKAALRQVEAEHPFRGPLNFSECGMSYSNKMKGDLKAFTGEELIFIGHSKAYGLSYSGGLIS